MARGREAVDHAIDLTEVGLDRVDDGGLHRIGVSRVAIERLRIQASGLGFPFQRRRNYTSQRCRSGRLPVLSKNTPSVAAFDPNAAAMREARP